MQENNKRNKEIITIKVLASAAVLNMLAAGFTLVYSKNQNKEMEATPTTSTTVETKPPYIPAEDRENEAFKTPFDFDQYAEDDSFSKYWNYYRVHGKLPTPTPPAFMNKGVESQTTATPTTVETKPPYTPETTDGTLPIPDEIAAKNPIYNEINNGTIPAPTEISAESMVRESQNPVYNEIKGNSEYITTINKDILYDLDPSIKPPVNPPFIPNEDSDEHTRSI